MKRLLFGLVLFLLVCLPAFPQAAGINVIGGGGGASGGGAGDVTQSANNNLEGSIKVAADASSKAIEDNEGGCTITLASGLVCPVAAQFTSVTLVDTALPGSIALDPGSASIITPWIQLGRDTNNPDAPAAAKIRLYQSAAGKLACIDSGSADCLPTGGATTEAALESNLTNVADVLTDLDGFAKTGLGNYLFRDTTATTGATQWRIQGGAGQSTTKLQQWISNAGTVGWQMNETGLALEAGTANSAYRVRASISTGTTNAGILFEPVAALTATSGSQRHLDTASVFSPTSGTATFSDIGCGVTINQTGGASGLTSCFRSHPTLTAAADFAHFRSEGDEPIWRHVVGSFASTIVVTAPTAARTITFKDESGTAAFVSDIPTSLASLATRNEVLLTNRAFDGSSPTTITIATGSLTLPSTGGFRLIAGEGGVADSWTALGGCTAGTYLVVAAASDTVDITVSETILANRSLDVLLDNDGDLLGLICRATNTLEQWFFIDESEGVGTSGVQFKELTVNGTSYFAIYGGDALAGTGCIYFADDVTVGDNEIMKATGNTASINSVTCREVNWEADAGGGSAPDRISLLNDLTVGEGSADVTQQLSSTFLTTDTFPHLVWVFADTAARDCLYTTAQIPSTATTSAFRFVVEWASSGTSGNFDPEVDYCAVAVGETVDCTSVESVGTVDAVAGTAWFRSQHEIDVTDANIAAGDTLQIALCRDGADGDTLAAAILLYGFDMKFN